MEGNNNTRTPPTTAAESGYPNPDLTLQNWCDLFMQLSDTDAVQALETLTIMDIPRTQLDFQNAINYLYEPELQASLTINQRQNVFWTGIDTIANRMKLQNQDARAIAIFYLMISRPKCTQAEIDAFERKFITATRDFWTEVGKYIRLLLFDQSTFGPMFSMELVKQGLVEAVFLRLIMLSDDPQNESLFVYVVDIKTALVAAEHRLQHGQTAQRFDRFPQHTGLELDNDGYLRRIPGTRVHAPTNDELGAFGRNFLAKEQGISGTDIEGTNEELGATERKIWASRRG